MKTIHYVLSEQCNMKCLYCNVDVRNTFTINYNKFIEFYNTYLINIEEDYIFDIFGGEPFLKTDICLDIVNFLQNIDKCKEIRITTNGTRFDDNILKIIEANKTRITISHDGLFQIKYRSSHKLYLIELSTALLMEDKPILVHSMISGQMMLENKTKHFLNISDDASCNEDKINLLYEQERYIKSLFYTHPNNVKVDFEIVRDIGTFDKQSADIFLKLFDDYVRLIVKDIQDDKITDIKQLNVLYAGMASDILINVLVSRYQKPTCGIDTGDYVSYFKNEIIPCERFARDKDSVNYLKDLNDKLFMQNLFKKCETCVVKNICNRGCIYEHIANGELIEEICDITIGMYRIIQNSFKIGDKKVLDLFYKAVTGGNNNDTTITTITTIRT